MGWWSESIMGGDYPLDIEGEFEDFFRARTPSPSEAISFIDHASTRFGSDHLVKQVTGFLMIRLQAPFNDELRRQVLEGISAENPEEDGWKAPEVRQQVLDDFRKIVEAYPNEGGLIDLPHQPGLFEKLGLLNQ